MNEFVQHSPSRRRSCSSATTPRGRAAVILPTVILVILGLIFGNAPAERSSAGKRFLDIFVPSLVVLTVATLSVQHDDDPTRDLPREGHSSASLDGTRSPVRPCSPPQLVINVVAAIVAVALLVIVVGNVAFGVPLPRNLPGVHPHAFGLGTSALFALGAAVRGGRPVGIGVATAVGLGVFFAVMFLGGVYLPRYLLPEIINQIGDVHAARRRRVCRTHGWAHRSTAGAARG